MRWLSGLAVAATLALGFSACTKTNQGSTPEAALRNYVQTAFSAKNDDARQKLLDMSVDEAKEWLASLTPDAFKAQFVDNAMVLVEVKTQDVRQEKNGDVSLVYELSFRDGKGPKPQDPAIAPSAASYSTKKIAYLKKDGEQWKIKATKNVKTYIERKDALEIPPNPPGYTEPESPEAKPKSK